ncbi:unnamed protein product [Effrenium voratum]|uniref:Uncharacterized protein n=1 Tax=Effrenium voratum TaxID=2562239 RepID=A0AA36IU51_9DINO|nr:unnamed protein product [Effrenium voratum]CAJ1421133.1 unnamed protein product [Effrenium voratum]
MELMLCRVAMLLAHASHVSAARTSSDLDQTLTTSCGLMDGLNVSAQVSRWSRWSLTTGGLRKESKSMCKHHFAVLPEYYTLAAYEGRWLEEKCKEGVDIGHSLCAQETNTGPSIAPPKIIDHWEKGLMDTGGGGWWAEQEADWCSSSPPPRWTGFEDCFQACQFHFRDCKQLECSTCAGSPANCDGIMDRDFTDRDGSVGPVRLYFFDACTFGCQHYVHLKSDQGGGPACEVGSKRWQKRTTRKQWGINPLWTGR